MIGVAFIGTPGVVDHRRLVEDLHSMADVFASGKAAAPLSLLSDIGGDLLYARRNDAGAWRLRRDEALHRLLASLSYRRAFQGALRVNWLLLALALGRKDLHRDFLGAGRCRLETVVKWLVLYGVDEHRLWRFLDRRFLVDLRRRAIPTPEGAVSPLDLILLAERPDLRGSAPLGSDAFARSLDEWIKRNGVHEYKLSWALEAAALQSMAAFPPPDLSASGAAFAPALASAHADGRIDLWVAPPGEGARRLAGVSRLSAQAQAESLRPPADETAPASDEEAVFVAPTPLSGDLASVFDFSPGDKGLSATTNGLFGRSTAEGAALLSPTATFFFTAPPGRETVIVIEMTLADDTASLLVRIDGEPADVFSAIGLSRRAAKVFARTSAGGRGLTVGLECISARAAAPYGWLRSLVVFAPRDTI